jgi:hypothetical protein
MRFFHRYLLLTITAILLLVSSNLHWGGTNWKNLILADGKGYYGYLPAAFIYHDLSFSFFDKIEKEYYYENTYYEYRVGYEGKTVNKYFAGTAVAMLPFFAAAHLTAHAAGYPPDGYSEPYPIAINIAAVFYLMLGLWYLRRSLITYGATPNQLLIILPAIAFGTNAFYYALNEPAMSHVYSFGFVAMFLFHSRKYFLSHDGKHLLLCAASLGMIILIRPVNGIVLLALPFLAGDIKELAACFRSLKDHVLAISISALLLLLIVSTQPIIYKIQTGHFIVYSYGSEGFNWSDPHMLDVLLSYKKGLFVYTPLWLIALPGFIGLYKEKRFAGISLFVFLLVVTYVLSSWWNWYYGGSFSSRVYIEFLPFLGILLLYTLKLIRSKAMKAVYLTLTAAVVLLCQLQTYQYRYGLIHWENMNKEKYWSVFLKMK